MDIKAERNTSEEQFIENKFVFGLVVKASLGDIKGIKEYPTIPILTLFIRRFQQVSYG